MKTGAVLLQHPSGLFVKMASKVVHVDGILNPIQGSEVSNLERTFPACYDNRNVAIYEIRKSEPCLPGSVFPTASCPRRTHGRVA